MMSLQEIADHLEIIQVIQRYAKALDEKRFDLLGTVFTKDAQLVYLIGQQLLDFPMRDAEKTFKAFLLKRYWTSHLISDPVIELRERQRACVERRNRHPYADPRGWVTQCVFH